MTDRARVAAELHRHLCEHGWHGYTQGQGRWGDGEGVCKVTVDGEAYEVEQGDRDCSSSVIECWRAALRGTPYEGRLDAATYTGDMRQAFVASGLFEWRPMTCVASQGDVYLNEASHTAMCQSAVPDMLSEFCIDEKGGVTGGAVGDQTGSESHVRRYYDYPWDGFLAYNGKADSACEGWTRSPGGWRYMRRGKWFANGWLKLDAWYLFDARGYACTGWQKSGGKWYWFDANCRMRTGWLKDKGKWHYLAESGAMAEGCTLVVAGKTYAFGKDGAMIEGSVPVDEDGALVL